MPGANNLRIFLGAVDLDLWADRSRTFDFDCNAFYAMFLIRVSCHQHKLFAYRMLIPCRRCREKRKGITNDPNSFLARLQQNLTLFKAIEVVEGEGPQLPQGFAGHWGGPKSSSQYWTVVPTTRNFQKLEHTKSPSQ